MSPRPKSAISMFSLSTEVIVICALSKTCELFTDKGNSILSLLNEIQPDKEWYYYPITKTNQKYEILFIKLNEKSKYIFRLDVLNKDMGKVEQVLSLLKSNSKDPVFLGYPYGLIEADRFARISNEELELLKTKFMIQKASNLNAFWQIVGITFKYDKELTKGLQHLFNNANPENYLIYLDSKPIGAATLFIDNKIGIISNLAVLPKYQLVWLRQKRFSNVQVVRY